VGRPQVRHSGGTATPTPSEHRAQIGHVPVPQAAHCAGNSSSAILPTAATLSTRADTSAAGTVPGMGDPHASLGQRSFRVRFDWGVEGAQACGRASDVVVVVDVLSFSTAVEIGTSRGGTIHPLRWADRGRADDLAERLGGTATTGPERRERRFTLSPTSLLEVTPGTVVVIPSPNGATVSLAAADLGTTVLCGCLRNASAVAEAAATRGETITVIAAGERWPNGALRPAVEDALGAGSILAHLPSDAMSPEARAATALASSTEVRDLVTGGVSAAEIAAAGRGRDAELAAEVDVSDTVPVLVDGAFVAAGT
jgi:2-phosphosulfolactate phosphatase